MGGHHCAKEGARGSRQANQRGRVGRALPADEGRRVRRLLQEPRAGHQQDAGCGGVAVARSPDGLDRHGGQRPHQTDDRDLRRRIRSDEDKSERRNRNAGHRIENRPRSRGKRHGRRRADHQGERGPLAAHERTGLVARRDQRSRTPTTRNRPTNWRSPLAISRTRADRSRCGRSKRWAKSTRAARRSPTSSR